MYKTLLLVYYTVHIRYIYNEIRATEGKDVQRTQEPRLIGRRRRNEIEIPPFMAEFDTNESKTKSTL